METFDFYMRLNGLIKGCCAGGNTPAELQHEMVQAIKDLNPGGRLYDEILEAKEE
jgi:hypothetical protein